MSYQYPPPDAGQGQGQIVYGQQQQAYQQPPQQGYGQYPSPPPGQQPPYSQGQPQVQQQAPQLQQQGYQVPQTSDTGAFQGGSYTVTHRDTNAILTLEIQQGTSIKAKPGAMIHMAATVQLTGEFKFLGSNESTFAGHGRVALAPTKFGDIVTLHCDGRTNWRIGKHVFLACTQGITRESKMQGFGQALFSGEKLFVYNIVGQGVVWLTSFGAVDRLDLQPGEQHIVDNGHLVAWSCDYKIEKAGGGSMTSLKTGEGFVCRFTGPGSVYIQTRNLDDFEEYIKDVAGTNKK